MYANAAAAPTMMTANIPTISVAMLGTSEANYVPRTVVRRRYGDSRRPITVRHRTNY